MILEKIRAGVMDSQHNYFQVGNGIELEAVGLQFKPYRWRPCGVNWDSSQTVVVIKLLQTSALHTQRPLYISSHQKVPFLNIMVQNSASNVQSCVLL